MEHQPQFIYKVMGLLEKVARNESAPEITDEIIESFGEKCKDILRKMQQGREDTGFKLYFSNLGQSARKLWLEKTYGRVPMDPYTTLKMKYGDIIEHLFIALLEASTDSVSDVNKRVELQVDDTTISGLIDLKINGEIIDVKSTTTYGYDTKFQDLDTVKAKDDFGYCSQLVGYAQAENSKAGGWIVIDKVTGAFKYINAASLNTLKTINETLDDFRYKIKIVKGELPPPSCNGVVDDVYNKKPTGRKILGSSCTYCQHKKQCHPTLSYEPVKESTAKNPPWRFYVNETNSQV